VTNTFWIRFDRVNRLQIASWESPSAAGPPHCCWFRAARNVNSFACCSTCSSVMSVSPAVAAGDGPVLAQRPWQ